LSIFNFTQQKQKEIEEFCKLNDIEIIQFMKECFDKGYQIEKYGLLTTDGQKVIEVEKEIIIEKPIEIIKEVVVEKPIEVIKEVVIEKPIEIINEVIVEKPVEIIKEVVIEKPVEIIKEVYITDDTQVNELLQKNNELITQLDKLENRPPEIVEKEVIIEKPIEIIKEVEVIKEVENKEKQILLQKTIQSLTEDIRKKDENILQLENNILELKKLTPIKAQYMGSSNLNDNLYK